MSWFARWFATTYIPALMLQAGGPITLFALFGLGGAVDAYLARNRILVAIVLLLHFLCYLIAAVGNADRENLEAFRREHLGDEDDGDA